MIYEQQRTTAQEIVTAFRSSNNVLLFAQMQSGKTGTFLEVARILLSTSRISNVMFVCGSSSLDLHAQLKADVREMDLYDDNVFKLHDMRWKDAPSRDTLIVWDEAHYGSKSGNALPEWFKRHGINTPGGLRRKGVNLLMVSATPFDLAFKPERIVKMNPPKEYRGVEYFIKRARENKNSAFENVLMQEGRGNGYGIVRISNALDEEMVVKAVLKANGSLENEWQIRRYYPGRSKLIAVSNLAVCLSKRPRQNTLILLKGRCRMGNVLPKQHLRFVYESTDVPNTTSILQSLLGRVCGYHRETINVYLPWAMITEGQTIPRSLREDETIVDKSELELYLWVFQQDAIPERVRKSKMYIL
jgi:hypothetical protein